MYIYAMTALAHAERDHAALASVLRGDIRNATRIAQQRTDDGLRLDDPAAYMHWATLCGDLMLAQDHDEDAEQSYRRALRGAAASVRGVTRVAACRNTGFMSLHQQRYGAAAASFQRVAADAAATPADRVEALCGLAAARHGMGALQPAREALDNAAQLAGEAGSRELRLMTDMWTIELQVQQKLRQHHALADHVFWRSPAVRVGGCMPEPDSVLSDIDDALARHADAPLFTRRLQHLRGLLRAMDGDAQALRDSPQHLAWLSQTGLVASERQARVEWALAALAVRNAEAARRLLEPLAGAAAGTRRWDLELSYCRAKLCELQGRSEESLQHYRRYALDSVMCVRAESAPAAEATAPQATTADEVELALPARYRRAYRYLLQHLDRHGLSMREVADHIGVTERALQSTFKQHIGLSPAELLRRCRMERIHRDLRHAGADNTTVAEVAERWGIRNRSTLVTAYRRQFGETPEQTRAGDAVHAVH